MIEKWSTQVYPITGKRPRTIYTYVPDEAADDPEARYPVLYMFDGHNVFFDEDATYGKSWGMYKYLAENNVPLIVVGIDCNHRPNNGRLSEYSPFSFNDEHFGQIHGRGRLFMEWMASTLKPMVDERYPTIPDREATFIAGSSMGGLMTLYALTAYNSVYSRGAALSPSVWVAPGKLAHLIQTSEMTPDTMLYIDYGSREMTNHEGMLEKYSMIVNQLMKKRIWLTSRIVPNGDHCEACWEEQIPFFMHLLMYERE